MADDMKVLIALAEAQNWRVELANGGHYKMYAPNGSGFVTAPSTGSDYRGLRNTITEMTKYGFKRPTKHVKKKRRDAQSLGLARSVGVPFRHIDTLPKYPYLDGLIGQWRTEDWFDADGLPLADDEWDGPNDMSMFASVLLEHYGEGRDETGRSVFLSRDVAESTLRFDQRTDKLLRTHFYALKYWAGIGNEATVPEGQNCVCGVMAEHGSLGLAEHIVPFLERGEEGHEPEGLLRWYDPSEIERAWAPIEVVNLREENSVLRDDRKELNRTVAAQQAHLARLRDAIKPLLEMPA